MRQGKSIGLSVLFLTLASVTAEADDTSPMSVLKEKGLSKSGTTYVIEAEQPVLQKMKEVKAVVAIYTKLAERQAVEEQAAAQLASLEESRTGLQGQLTDLNQRIIEQGTMQQAGNGSRQGPNGPQQASPLIAQRNQVQAMLADVTMQEKALKAQSPPAKDRSALDEDVKKRGEAVKVALAELRPMVDEVMKKYAGLEADPAIKKAKNDFQKATKANLKLGPSDAFRAGVKALEQAERQLIGKKMVNTPRKKAKAKK